MPRPPIIPTLNWNEIYRSGRTWADWLSGAEFPDKREKMETALRELAVPAEVASVLSQITRPVHVVAIAEDWCGDVVRHAPVLELVARQQPRIQVRYITREQYPDVFVRFLTNGGEAIPKFVFLSADFVECGNWGPMEEAARRLISRGKACGNVAAARTKVSAMYEADSQRYQVFRELAELAALASCTEP